MKASLDWLATSGLEFSPGAGKSGLADLRHYTARYCEWGEGQPLVLVPGLAGGFDLLGPLARLLAGRYRVIAFQLRGEDDCFALRQRFDLADLVNDLREFLDWRGLETPAVLGVSFGGALALELAARWPRRISALALQGTGVRLEKGLLQQIASLVLARYPLPADNPFINQFFRLLFGGPQEPGPLFEFVTSRCWQTDQSVMAHRLKLIQHFDIESRLGDIQVPTLIMAGTRDLLVSETSRQVLANGIVRSQLVELPGSGHLASVTRPQDVAAAVIRFLNGLVE